MKFKLFMRIMKYFLSLMHFFYVGFIAIILLLIGIFSPFIHNLGLVVLLLWFVLAAIDQIVLNNAMNKNPELQEYINSVMANETNFGRVPVGSEVTFCNIEGEDLSLVGRCLDSETGKWNTRLLYNGTYQMFSWNLVYNEQFLPQMKLLSDMPGHEEDILVKCYSRLSDGKARWQLHLLKKDGAIYKDIALDTIKLIEAVGQAYKMECVKEESKVWLECADDENSMFTNQRIAIDNKLTCGTFPVSMVYGDVIMIDMEQMKIKLSVGAKCEDMSIGQISDFNVIGDIVIGDDDIAVDGVCIARM